ncbi:MAG: type II toxin-antitoxin system HicA family toxin [Anaerolineae bacterium]|nr:type II toxin-antitoxin system HicA family toxin [Anaerolineae bacterium]
MRYRQMVKKLKNLGCEFERQASGSHEVWFNPKTNKKAVISDYGNKDIPPGTVRGILKQLGIDRKEFGPIK